LYVKTAPNTPASGDRGEKYGGSVNVAYHCFLSTSVAADVDYNHVGQYHDRAAGNPTVGGNWVGANNVNSIGGILRFQRSF